jgi:hypothetical protein
LAVELDGEHLTITIGWKILIFIGSNSCGLNIGFLLIEINVFDELKEML